MGLFTTGLTRWQVAFDIQNHREIPFDRIRGDLAAGMRNAYKVPLQEDPLQWASTTDAFSAFFRLHPDIRVTY
jgi:hypothetical protein